ncbi:putative membrane protein [Arcobacter venerupis]|uniref:Membrane protein n=1 Tax=Arcobacter venerupis TaxID=1054033 RepID=A0AAE7B6T5_9BACT|nr:hypothetical protein [Arcobacter venerupis]QKF65661.1 putative membrane protein [Arcobacter venerupis]RWS50173.1 hypothetical protein CKA56_04365 [Arcobacter venerupis]
MKDMINSFKANLYERTTSPLLGSFIFYWIICNYKFIVILFDKDLTSENKFVAIDNLYKTDYISISILNIPINGLLLPLLIALAYVLVLPFISKFIHKAWIWHQNELKKISNGKVLTEKEFGELQQKYFELELSFSKTFSEKDKEITQLRKFLDEKEHLLLESLNKIDEYKKDTKNTEELIQENQKLQNNLKTFSEHNTLLKKELDKTYRNSSDEERLIMKDFASNHKKETTLEEISKLLNLPELKADYILKNLIAKRLLTNEYSPNKQQYIYKVNDEGKKYIVENGLI